jgi:hypothetical protein
MFSKLAVHSLSRNPTNKQEWRSVIRAMAQDYNPDNPPKFKDMKVAFDGLEKIIKKCERASEFSIPIDAYDTFSRICACMPDSDAQRYAVIYQQKKYTNQMRMKNVLCADKESIQAMHLGTQNEHALWHLNKAVTYYYLAGYVDDAYSMCTIANQNIAKKINKSTAMDIIDELEDKHQLIISTKCSTCITIKEAQWVGLQIDPHNFTNFAILANDVEYMRNREN